MAPTIAELKQQMNWNNTVLSIHTDSTAAQAAFLMSSHSIGCLIVFDEDNQFVGILSERDMLQKICAGNLLPETIKVGDIMTSSVITCSLDMPIMEAERLMSLHHVRHLPVIENNLPIGMISSRDVIAFRMNNSKAMQMAAEELAMLPAGLKSLDLKDIVTMAIHEVPKSFGAEKAALWFKAHEDDRICVYQNECPCTEKTFSQSLTHADSSPSIKMMMTNPCSDCGNSCSTVCKLMIPLFIHSDCSTRVQSPSGYLCVCRPDHPTIKTDQTQRYKATILQQVLGANLTNALLYNNYKEARRNSEIDPLTGVGTRRVLEKVLKNECARALRYGRPFSLAIVDLDNFKQINDTAGHAAGDEALKYLADLMRHITRDTDIVITRYGGDEFVLILPETKLAGAETLTERIRGTFNQCSLPKLKQQSISAGVAEWSADGPDTPDSIMQRADACLYEAKKRGRNCVVTCPESIMSAS